MSKAQIQRPSSASQAGRTPQRRHEVSRELGQGQGQEGRPGPGLQTSAAAVYRPGASGPGTAHVYLGRTLNGRGDMPSLLL